MKSSRLIAVKLNEMGFTEKESTQRGWRCFGNGSTNVWLTTRKIKVGETFKAAVVVSDTELFGG